MNEDELKATIEVIFTDVSGFSGSKDLEPSYFCVLYD